MQVTTLALSLIAILAASPAVLARKDRGTATYVQYFDNPHNSVDGVACGVELRAKGWKTIGHIRGGNPYLAGAPGTWAKQRKGLDKACGSCVKLAHGSKHVYAVLIDSSDKSGESDEWDLSTAAFTALGTKKAIQAGELPISVSAVPPNEQWKCDHKKSKRPHSRSDEEDRWDDW